MEHQPNLPNCGLSRRCLLRNAAFTAGGAALLGTALSRPASAKATQKAVAYQDTPHGAQQCDNCSQFAPPDECKTVDGKVSPKGWCKIYVKKPGS